MSIVRRLRRTQEEAKPLKNVAVCTPCGDEVATPYCVSLAQLFMYTATHLPKDLGFVSLQNFASSILPGSRNIIAKSALEQGVSHLLWIDSDMEFAPDLLCRLLAHDLDIVGANCTMRRPPHRNTARIGDADLETNLFSTGLQEVERLGFGVVMVSADVFNALPMPWFAFEWIPETAVFRGEDFYFFDRARKAGFEVYVDHDVSKDVKHIGTFGYSPVLKSLMAEQTAEIVQPDPLPNKERESGGVA